MKQLIAADLMTGSPICTSPKTDLATCAKMMVRKRVGSLLIVEGKKLRGILTYHDILWALVKKDQNNLKSIMAMDISPKKIATIRPKAPIEEVLKKMKKFKFERLPVIQDGELVGMITARDILNFHPELYHELDEFAEIREQERKLSLVKKAKRPIEGICEECGSLEMLFRFNGMLVCEECRDST